MWTCPSCGTSNEPHAIFCSSCGASRYKAPVREPASPEPVADWPTAGPPEFRGTIAGFTAAWIAVTLAAGFGAWLSQTILSFGMRFSTSPGSWGFVAMRMAWGITYGFAYGGLVGAFQSWVLRRRVRRPGWNGWILATLGGTVVVSVAANLTPVSMWGETGIAARIPMVALVGLIGGGLVGLLQSRVLSRVVAPGGWTGWWLVSSGAHALGNAAGLMAWHVLFDRTNYSPLLMSVAGLANMVADSGLTALLTALALARMLRRRCAPPPK